MVNSLIFIIICQHDVTVSNRKTLIKDIDCVIHLLFQLVLSVVDTNRVVMPV